MTSLYQHGTLAMLMGKQMQGTITAAELLKHGDTGIGTLTGLNGEVIILEGQVYQAQSDGQVNHITDLDTLLPFASIHFYNPTQNLPFDQVDFTTLSDQLKSAQLQNIFSSVNFHADFSRMHVRIAPKQVTPFPSLLEVATNQPEFEETNISGTVMGYYAPEIFNGPTAAGWHLHFLSDDKSFAGHILDFSATHVTGTLQVFDEFVQHLPIENADFRGMSLDLDGLHAGIEASEGGKK
ncbi:acetolactate decarboxylase [Leuconostoc inhae]|mgnify:FL=1|uniref:acetolactate decarboxylase n=1 Tax=Leuconostoc inhae TaxID=178001 RepID=UPI001C7CADC0|nr:acetolactate decarboxylase [Leuconostoc inhae]